MSNDDWTHVRVRRATKARLEAIQAAREAARLAGVPACQDIPPDGESIDALVGYLCKVWEDRRRRRRS